MLKRQTRSVIVRVAAAAILRGGKNEAGRTRREEQDGKNNVSASTEFAHALVAKNYTQTTDVEGEVNGLMTYDR